MFYVYVLTDPSKEYNRRHCRFLFKEEPFYVGKGSGFRALVHLKQATKANTSDTNAAKLKRIRSLLRKGHEVVPRILRWFDSEAEAFALEISLIRSIGRKDIGTGCLTNRTFGGDGISGIVGLTRSSDTKGKISEAVRRFLESESPKDKRRRYFNQAAAFEARTPEEKHALAEAKREIAINRHARLTAAEKKRIYAKSSESLKEYYAALTSAQKKSRCQRIAEGVRSWASSRSEENIQKANLARKKAWDRKPATEIQEFTEKRLRATDLVAAAKKRSKSFRKRTPQQIQASVDKRLATMGLSRRR